MKDVLGNTLREYDRVVVAIDKEQLRLATVVTVNDRDESVTLLIEGVEGKYNSTLYIPSVSVCKI